MRETGRRLEKQEALIGGGGEDPPPPGLMRHRVEIKGGVETQEGELKSILPPLLAMTGPGITAGSRQDRLDVALERGHSHVASTRAGMQDRE